MGSLRKRAKVVTFGAVSTRTTRLILGVSFRRDFDRLLLLRGEVGAYGPRACGGVQGLLRVALEVRHHVAGDQLVAA